MIVFPASPDWARPIAERIGFLTDIIRAYDDTEQRIQLRETANGGIAFRAMCTDAREAAMIEARLWTQQPHIVLVPWWQDATPLLAGVNAGATLLQVETGNRDFYEGGRFILWRDHTDFEEGIIDNITSAGYIVPQSALDNAFAANTDVIPLKRCRLESSQVIEHPGAEVSEIDIRFTTEADEMRAYTGGSPTQYQGFDLLDEVTPNNRQDAEAEYTRSAILLDSRTSIRTVDDHSELATVKRKFNWFAYGRDDIAQLKRFIHRRKGRAVPFWVPTYRNDLPLAEAVTGGGTSFEIMDVGYSSHQFPDDARRHIAFITPSGAITAREVLDAHANSNGNETITVSGALPAGGFPASTMVSFLTLARLDEDDIEISWSSRVLAEADLPYVEITKEVQQS